MSIKFKSEFIINKIRIETFIESIKPNNRQDNNKNSYNKKANILKLLSFLYSSPWLFVLLMQNIKASQYFSCMNDAISSFDEKWDINNFYNQYSEYKNFITSLNKISNKIVKNDEQEEFDNLIYNLHCQVKHFITYVNNIPNEFKVDISLLIMNKCNLFKNWKQACKNIHETFLAYEIQNIINYLNKTESLYEKQKHNTFMLDLLILYDFKNFESQNNSIFAKDAYQELCNITKSICDLYSKILKVDNYSDFITSHLSLIIEIFELRNDISLQSRFEKEPQNKND